jgi:hypothetical protein
MAIQNKRRGMMTYGVVLLQCNALLEHCNWELFDHHPFSPDLTPSHYQLFTYLKNYLGSQRFNNNEVELSGGRLL